MKKLLIITLIFILNCVNLRFFNKNNIVYAVKTSAEAMATIEVSTGRILFSKNENKKLPMASTTKILTAIVAIENCKNLEEKHKIPKEAVGIEGSSIYLKAGEHLSVIELLYGLMLRSGNDSAVAIAIIIAGSVENFVVLMNNKCDELGLKDTNIVTVNGLHDENHYTTAKDLALITAYAMQNETFSKIVSTKEIAVSNEMGKTNKRYFRNKNRLLNMLEGANGVKTGYTKKAGRCFVGSMTKNNMQVVCVVLNCPPMFEETKQLLTEAFNTFSMTKLFETGEILVINTEDKNPQKVPILIKKDIYYPLKQGEIVDITAKLDIIDNLKVPLNENQSIGTINVNLKNDLIFSDKIYTINVGKNVTVKDNFRKIIKAF